MCGVVRDGVIPGFMAMRPVNQPSGTCSGGSSSAASHHRSTRSRASRRDRPRGPRQFGGEPRPGESGLLALDWWNGNRSVLVDADLTGVLIGMTLAPRRQRSIEPSSKPRRSAPGSSSMRSRRAASDRSRRRCGGLPDRSPLLMQIFADVTGRSWRVAASSQTPALGRAMFAAVAAGPGAGGYGSIEDAAAAMAHLRDVSSIRIR